MFNVNELMHAINLKMLTRIFFLTQINRIIRFASNFFPHRSAEGSVCV